MTDLLSETYGAVTVNKVRSLLTMLGIVIGIASVIAMVAIGEGAQSSIANRIQSIGSNLITISPGATRGPGTQVSAGRGTSQTLTLADSNALATQIPDVSAVAPQISKRYQVAYKGQNTNTSVIGTNAAFATIRALEMEDGVFLNDQDSTSYNKVAVIGPTTRDDLFGIGSTNAVGSTIKINKIQFKIIGVTKSKGSSFGGNQDDVIYVPDTTASRFFSGNQYVSSISAQATNETVLAAAQQEITDLLLTRHKISDPTLADFSTLNQADIVATATSVTGTFTILLGAIASISLLVGGIGIMNMMLTTVTERTREIGLRKSIGAKKNDISRQFLAESITLTFVGGVVGVLLGWLIASVASQFMGISTFISWNSVILAFGVSAGIGVIFGYYPARRAAGLNPIEALRYE